MTRHVDLLTSIANTIEPVWMAHLPSHARLKTDEVAQLFGVATGTILKACKDGRVPQPIRAKEGVGSHVHITYRWTLGTLRKFMRECRDGSDTIMDAK